MSCHGPRVVPDGATNILQPNKINQTQKQSNEKKEYSKDLQSRFGTAFLPYASQLESVEQYRTIRKGRRKNKKKKPVRTTKIPGYKSTDKKKGQIFDTQCNNNKKK